MNAPANDAPIYGLVLAGGRSKRMQRDKAVLEYRGTSQLARAMTLLEPRVARTFVSVRPDQVSDPVRAQYAQILDTQEGLGPIAGIVAAQAQYPLAAWLVLACDLPFLDEETLDQLLRARRPELQATAYRSSHDGLAEPLCAIYEPSSREAILRYLGTGRHCPRKFLGQARVELLDQPNPGALDNINTPQEYGAAAASLRDTRKAHEAHAASGSPHP